MFDIQNNSTEYREQVLRMSKKIRHRGPDWSGIFCGERAIISHERLSIVDPQSGRQPLYSSDGKIVLAVNGDDGYPFAIPVNYFYDQDQDKIYFHGAKSGHKVDALKKNDKVCFTVYGNEHFEPGDWAPYVQSTVVFGRCRLVEDAAATEARVRELGLKYYPGREEVEKEIAKAIKGVQLYEITIEHLTGKQIQEK